MKKNKKSPLNNSPLRYAGQSLDEEIDKIFKDEIDTYAFASVFAIGYAVFEWFRWYLNAPYYPVMFTVLTIILVGYCSVKLFSLRKKITNLRLGRDGERAVGQYLELLRENGCKVIHDIIGENFNIDHVLICQKGIFSIETKTYSKPIKGEAKITFSKNGLSINGYPESRKIINQIKAEANWLKQKISSLAGKCVEVKPVVVFPGWYIETAKGYYCTDVWVLNPKALPKYINNLPNIYTKEEVAFISNSLTRYIRAS